MLILAKLKISACVLLILIATYIFLSPCLKNDFVNWDDPYYVTENPAINSLSLPAVKAIFGSFIMGNYQPITVLSYALERHFLGLKPAGFHAANLLLHLIDCLLVFWFIYRLSNSLFIAFFTAILFAVHPLRVESVAWISQTKDMLYAFFFLTALISYLNYLKGGDTARYYYLCLTLFILSCISKPMAVSLPLVLLAIDYFVQGKINRRRIKEKIPFLAISLIFIAVTIYAYNTSGLMRHKYLFSFGQRTALAFSAIGFYLFKTLLPIRLCCFYPYPDTSFWNLPRIYLISALIVLLLLAVVIYSKKYTRKAVFGSAFFLLCISPALKIVPFANYLAADRFTYVASIGLFFMAAEFFYWLYAKKSKHQPAIRAMLLLFLTALIAALGALSWNRAKIWKNSFALSEDIIKKYPGSYLGRIMRGIAYQDSGDYVKALADFNQAVAIDPLSPHAYTNLCHTYNLLAKYEQAKPFCQKAISLDPANAKAYFNLGGSYAELGDNANAIVAYKKAIGIDKAYADAYNNLATVYVSLRDYPAAISLLDKALKIRPDFAEAYYNLAVIYADTKEFALANQYCAKAMSLGLKPEDDLLEELKSHSERP